MVFQHGAMSVWSNEPTIPLAGKGVIIGHLFTRTLPSRRVVELTDAELAAIERSGGRNLLTDYWGGYVAIMACDGGVAILRDPSGAMPCLFRSGSDGLSLASEAGLLLSGNGARPEVSYRELARFLWSADAMGRQTCLADVQELVPGECLRSDGLTTEIMTWWSPWTFAGDSLRSASNEIVDALRETARDCVCSWASCFRTILLGVSGGLDSSIVAALIPRESVDLRCLTMVGPDADGDERRHAGMLADAHGLPLEAVRYDLGDVDVERPILPHLPWPVARYFAQGLQAVHERLHRQRPIDAFFTGSGGDNVFCFLQSVTPLVDRVLARRVGPGLFRTLLDVCDLTESDWLSVSRAAWRKYRQGRAGVRPFRDPSGLLPSTVAEIEQTGDPHPWLVVPAGILPGRAAHVAMMMRALKGLELYPRATHPPQIAPLLSQPLVELCLRIPSWEWVAGGINRAQARKAFANELPEALLRRRSKGGPSGFMQQLYEVQESRIYRLLKLGSLVENGVLDPAFLAPPIDPSWRGIARAQRIMSLAAAECWVRWWQDANTRAQ